MGVDQRRRGASSARLAAAVALACAAGAALPAHGRSTASAPMHDGALSVRADLRSLMPSAVQARHAPATVLPVTSCADGSAAGTLRAVVAAAGDGDTVDLSHLHCSSITLTHGAIPVLLDNLALTGPGASALAIDGGGGDRVFIHPGYGALSIQGLSVRNGGSRVSGNHVTGGGCIASAGYVVLDHARVHDCFASGEGVYGGGVFGYALYMYTSTLSRSTARGASPGGGTASFGGGAYAAYLKISNSTISGNRAEHDPGNVSSYDIGGGLFSNNGGTVYSSTIEGNYSSRIGGGIATFFGALAVFNSTISGNTAQSGSGGGIDARAFFGGVVTNTTVTANRAALGGGIYLRGAPDNFILDSVLVAGNAAPAGGADIGAVSEVTLLGANNLVVDSQTVLLPADTLHANPHLQPLADNGGPTRTHGLAPGSPAIDAGNNLASVLNDQRGEGHPRLLGEAPDIGAFEGTVVPVRVPVNIPAVSPGMLLLLGAALVLTAAQRAFFTRLSPRGRHSSHR